MALSNNNPFYGSSGSNMPANGGQQRLALDNLIRRELKVGDPNDPKQIADALLNRFKDDPRANAITQEAKGLPFLQSSVAPAMMVKSPTSSETEWQQALDDINRDFEELTTNAILKDIKTELQGWASAIRSTVAEGVNAARFALDTRQRDKVFAVRRTLGDYARLARIVGTLTPSLTVNYRKLAQSLDEAASVLLVIMGEALANVGFSGGRFLLQVPFSELQARREAVVFALRNLLGTTQEAYGNDWHRGIGAYRALMKTLEDQGQGDLRSLLVENELMRTMDMLIHIAGQGGVEGLRQLGVTAQIEVERFRRLIFIAQNNGTYAAPPLAAFLDALLLFAQGFDASGGFRLLRVARPPILFYGLYGIGGMDNADQRLVRLIVQRGALAEKLDCFSQRALGTESEKAQSQIVLDKILYDTDRAIDLYAVGTKDFGDPEIRASAYADLIEEVVDQATMSGRIEVRGSGRGFIEKGTGVSANKDIGRTNDDFFFANIPIDIPHLGEYYEPKSVTLQGEIVARVTDIVNVGPYTMAGLMLRNKNDVNESPFAYIALCPNRGILFGKRTKNGASEWNPPLEDTAKEDAPYWLSLTWKITRIVDTDKNPDEYKTIVIVTGWKSESGDDSDWQEVDSITIEIIENSEPTPWYIGLAVTAAIPVGGSTTNIWVCTAAFDHVSIEGAQKTGEDKSHWDKKKIGDVVNREGNINFSESFFALTLRDDFILKEILNRLEELLSPEDSNEPWDDESENLSQQEVAKMLRKKELCIQKDQESRWDNLVKTMAPSCHGYSSAIVRRLLDNVTRKESDVECKELDVMIPTTVEENTFKLTDAIRESFGGE